ncbi:ADP-ribosylglycohydrolase family protein [Paramagnetospirillum magneticum]|nr:ADP-ribosylglycohydrolase family protein [Paramagnetospirillum magneticum]
MYGAIAGDIIGSIYEFENHKSRSFPLFTEGASFFTDDTICTMAVMEALLDDADPAVTLRKWGAEFPDAGYGGMFGSWLRRPDMPPYNSYGNGSAMRVSPAGFLAYSLDEAVELAIKVTAVTHDHPDGIAGAVATASAIYLAFHGEDRPSIRSFITDRFGYDMSQSVDEIRPWYEFDETCPGSVPQALTCALEATSYEEAIRNAISIGGDSDTIACIAGAVAEALFGVPHDIAVEADARMYPSMVRLISRMYQVRGRANPTKKSEMA